LLAYLPILPLASQNAEIGVELPKKIAR
jgi:hypothetical protein